MSKLTSLRRADQFKKVKKDGQKIVNNGLEVFIVNSGMAEARLGIQISSKIANSVTRNKVRRRIKEAARFLEKKESIDMVVVVKKKGLEADLFTIENTLKEHPSL